MAENASLPSTKKAIDFWYDQYPEIWNDMQDAPDALQYLHSRVDATKYRRSLFTRMMAAGLFADYHFRWHYVKRSHETNRGTRKALPTAYRKVPDMTWEQYWDWLNGTPEFHGMLWRIQIGMQSIVHEHCHGKNLGGYKVMIARLRLLLSYAMGPCPKLDVVGTDPKYMTIVAVDADGKTTVLAHMSGIYQSHLMALVERQKENRNDEA